MFVVAGFGLTATARAEPAPGPPGGALEGAIEAGKTVLRQIGEANAALDRSDSKGAQAALDLAAGTLRQLYTAVPAGPVLNQLGSTERAEPPDLAPILAEVRSRAVWMDPDIVAELEQADRRLKKGDRVAAAAHLVAARRLLTADVALLPLEDAYARVQAARGELRDGHSDQARRLLRNVPLALARVEATAPLVPIRLGLRAAATAAERGEWDAARELVTRALRDLEQVAGSSPGQELERAIKPVVDRARTLQRRIVAGGKPRPKDLRDLAARTRLLARRSS
jgi:hypothetical protein